MWPIRRPRPEHKAKWDLRLTCDDSLLYTLQYILQQRIFCPKSGCQEIELFFFQLLIIYLKGKMKYISCLGIFNGISILSSVFLEINVSKLNLIAIFPNKVLVIVQDCIVNKKEPSIQYWRLSLCL